MDITIIVEKGDDGYYVGQIEEYPHVISQGKTLDELEMNLEDAFDLFYKYEKLKESKIDKTKHFKKYKIKYRRKMDFGKPIYILKDDEKIIREDIPKGFENKKRIKKVTKLLETIEKKNKKESIKKNKLLNDIEQSLKQVKEGKTKPLKELLNQKKK